MARLPGRRRPASANVCAAVVGTALGAVSMAGACSSSSDRAPMLRGPYEGSTGGATFDPDAGSGPPPADADASGICGNEVHPIIVDAPNLYFVLDASGSMGVAAGGTYGTQTKYDVVRIAAVDFVRTLGPLINVGAAVFPRYASGVNACHVGGQVFPVTPGDSVTGEDGPTTTGFRLSTITTPAGGTPTAATLEALTPTLEALGGKTFVLLATDGGPNCDADFQCTAAECMPNIENASECYNVNCCAPNGLYGPTSCLDLDATISAIAAIRAANIPVYVIGIPGSEVYADALAKMAVAGGTAQPGPPYYYPVDQLENVGPVLASIASIVVTCVFELQDAPPDPNQTNVYFDQQVVPYDPINGWHWTSPTTVTVEGTSCARLKAGQVKQVQIVSGCPTEMPK